MAAAGLTHGGFYGHFVSKDQLVAEACGVGMDSIVERVSAAAREPGGKGSLAAIAASYLAREHRDDPAGGCPLAGLGSELVRSSEDTRAEASGGFMELVEIVAAQFGGVGRRTAKEKALVAVSAMIGAVTMSRIVQDPGLSDAILKQTEIYLLQL